MQRKKKFLGVRKSRRPSGAVRVADHSLVHDQVELLLRYVPEDLLHALRTEAKHLTLNHRLQVERRHHARDLSKPRTRQRTNP